MYLGCRPPRHTRQFRAKAGSSSFKSLAFHPVQRLFSQHRRPQQKRERRQRVVRSLIPSRLFHSTSTLPNAAPNVAIVGGGITGLTAAYTISRDPNAKVTLYEKSSKLGGWMKETETVKAGDKEVLFEYGPRSFRYSGATSYTACKLLLDLGLKDHIVYTTKDSLESQNRYIYNKDRLVRIPMPTPSSKTPVVKAMFTALGNVLSEPLFRHLAWQCVMEFFWQRAGGRKRGGDESVADFVSRKLSPRVVDDFASAMAHGIYAGDLDKLSIKAISYYYWFLDQQSPSVLRMLQAQARKRRLLMYGEDHDAISLATKEEVERKELSRVADVVAMGKNLTSFHLEGGMVQLVDRLVEVLAESENVELKTDAHIEKISGSYKSPMEVQLADGSSQKYDYLISTTSPRQLANHLQGPSAISSSSGNDTVQLLNSGSDHAVTVMVVNFFFEKPNLVPVAGFGYLIPQSTPLSQNPERALGVIFGNEPNAEGKTARGTKLTVMLGGRWWDGWKEGDYPDEQKAIEMGRSLLKRHLNISETPTVARARLQHDAIPQPAVGHYDRMGELDRALRRDYGDKLKVGGAWYTGVSINHCIRTGTLFGLRLRHPRDDGLSGTGLGTFSAGDGFRNPTAPLRLVDTTQPLWAHMFGLKAGSKPASKTGFKNAPASNNKGEKKKG